MNIDSDCIAANRRLKEFIRHEAKKMKDVTHSIFTTPISVQSRLITINNRDHFYKLVNYSNKNFGQGRMNWTSSGRILRYVDPSKNKYDPPRYVVWKIFGKKNSETLVSL